MTTPYATVDDLHAYLGADPPADSQRLLARAQDLLNAVLINAYYASDANGNPADATVIAAFTKACCAQVEFWIANGDDLDQLGNWTSYAIGGVSVTRDPKSWQRWSRLCPRAWDALRGVLSGTAFGSHPLLPAKPVV